MPGEGVNVLILLRFGALTYSFCVFGRALLCGAFTPLVFLGMCFCFAVRCFCEILLVSGLFVKKQAERCVFLLCVCVHPARTPSIIRWL